MKIIYLASSGGFVRYSESHISDQDARDILEDIPDEAISPHKMAEGWGEYDTILACLTERQREYVALRIDGYSYREIAEKMGVKYTYSKNMWQRIRDRLRAHGYGLEFQRG